MMRRGGRGCSPSKMAPIGGMHSNSSRTEEPQEPQHAAALESNLDQDEVCSKERCLCFPFFRLFFFFFFPFFFLFGFFEFSCPSLPLFRRVILFLCRRVVSMDLPFTRLPLPSRPLPCFLPRLFWTFSAIWVPPICALSFWCVACGRWSRPTRLCGARWWCGASPTFTASSRPAPAGEGLPSRSGECRRGEQQRQQYRHH